MKNIELAKKNRRVSINAIDVGMIPETDDHIYLIPTNEMYNPSYYFFYEEKGGWTGLLKDDVLEKIDNAIEKKEYYIKDLYATVVVTGL